MKTAIATLFFLSLGILVSAQSNKFNIGIEVSPNFSKTGIPYPYSHILGPSGFYPAINLDLKSGYELSRRFTLTCGVGYMMTRQYQDYDWPGDGEYDRIVSNLFHSYVFVPLGMKYNLGSFFISPEIGVGWNTSNRVKSTVYFTDGSVTEYNNNDPDNIHHFNTVTYPVFLSFGNEIQVKSCTIAIGMKSYYGLNPIGNRDQYKGHYYGFGIFGGVRF